MKTCQRPSVPDECLPGLCMISVNREKVSKEKQDFIKRVIDRFGRDLRSGACSSCF